MREKKGGKKKAKAVVSSPSSQFVRSVFILLMNELQVYIKNV